MWDWRLVGLGGGVGQLGGESRTNSMHRERIEGGTGMAMVVDLKIVHRQREIHERHRTLRCRHIDPSIRIEGLGEALVENRKQILQCNRTCWDQSSCDLPSHRVPAHWFGQKYQPSRTVLIVESLLQRVWRSLDWWHRDDHWSFGSCMEHSTRKYSGSWRDVDRHNSRNT